jgi:hypothetical protein
MTKKQLAIDLGISRFKLYRLLKQEWFIKLLHNQEMIENAKNFTQNIVF